MLTNLWLLSLFFLANILIALGLLSYAWIYLDAFLTERKAKDAFRGLGGILISIYFIITIVNINAGLGNLTLFMLLLFSLGLFSIFYGNLLEPIPGLPDSNLPKLKKINYFAIFIFFSIGAILAFINIYFRQFNLIIGLDFILFCFILIYILLSYKSLLGANTGVENEESLRKQRNLSLFLIVMPFFTSALLSILITIQNFKKVLEGLSKEFKYLAVFWLMFSAYSIIQLFSLLGQYYFISFDAFTRQYSILWIVSQVILIICAILLFKWIQLFISFRIEAKLFLYIWQIAIFLTVVLASAYSIFIISSSESQVSDLLTKNANLLQFNLDQIKSNNMDLLSIISGNKKLSSAIMDNDSSSIENEIKDFVGKNSFLDKVQVVSATASLIYDSEQPTDEGTSLSSNKVISSSIFSRSPSAGFIVEKNGIDNLALEYEFAYPILEVNGRLDGVIISTKRLNDSFLDLLKKQTDQELVIYANGKRSASTILQADNLSRLQNLPLVVDGMISSNGNVSFYKGRILTTPYYLAVINLNDVEGNNIGNIVIATKQEVLINITQHSLFDLFILSLILTLITTLPSFILAKSLRKNLSV